jgi:hypothetical protein
MRITSTIVKITNNSIAIIAVSNTNAHNANDCGGEGLSDGWHRFPVHRQHTGRA